MQFRKYILIAILVLIPINLSIVQIGSAAQSSYEDVLKTLTTLQERGKESGNQRVSVYTIGNSVEGRQIPIVIIQDPTVDIMSTKRLLITARQHGNEPAPTEAALEIARRFATTTDPNDLDLLKKVSFLIIPMTNPDGAAHNERRNANGADLNRDWVAQTQPETRAVIDVVHKYKPDMFVDCHELAPGNPTPDFVETPGAPAGAPPGIAQINIDLEKKVLASIAANYKPVNHIVSQSPREPDLAHRYFSVEVGIPSLLLETTQVGRENNITYRRDVQVTALLSAAKYLSGADFSDVYAKLAQKKADNARFGYRTASLSSRGGSVKRSGTVKKWSKSSRRHYRKRRW